MWFLSWENLETDKKEESLKVQGRGHRREIKYLLRNGAIQRKRKEIT